MVGARGALAGEEGANLTDLTRLALGSSPDQASGGRWGDYMGAALDPLNPAVVWIAAQVGDVAGNIDWSTHIDTASFNANALPAPDGYQVYPGFYSGHTNQHERIRLRTSGDGRRMISIGVNTRERCRIHHHRLHLGATLLSNAASRLIAGTGRFSASGHFGADPVVTSTQVRVKGVIFANHATGTLTTSEHSRSYGLCRSGRVRWTAA